MVTLFEHRLIPLMVTCVALSATHTAFAQPQIAPSTRLGAASQPSLKRVELPSFGISVPLPDGYVRDLDSGSSVFFFVPIDYLPTATPGALIYLDISEKKDLKLSDLASRVSKSDLLAEIRVNEKWGNVNDATDVSGVGRPSVPGKLTLRRCLLAERGKYIFTLFCLTDAQHASAETAFDQIVRGTQWSKPETAGHGLILRQPVLGWRNEMLACIPDPFRPDIRPEKKPSRISWFYALDLPSGNRVANLMVVPLSGSDAPHSLNEAKVDAKRNLSEVIDLKEPFRWSEEDGDEHFAITPSLKNGKGWVQILIARTNEKSVAVFVLQCDSVANLEATDGMDGALVLLRRSIQSALKNSPSKQP